MIDSSPYFHRSFESAPSRNSFKSPDFRQPFSDSSRHSNNERIGGELASLSGEFTIATDIHHVVGTLFKLVATPPEAQALLARPSRV